MTTEKKGKKKTTVSRKSRNKKTFFIYKTGILLLIILSIGIFYVYKKYAIDTFSEKSFMLYIYPNTSLEQIIDKLKRETDQHEANRFERIAKLNRFHPGSKSGAYRIDPEMSAMDVYRMIARGIQTPVRFTFNNIRTKEQFAERVEKQLMISADSILPLLNDSAVCQNYGFTPATIPAMFIPDTYEMYWTVSPRKFLDRMKKEYDLFWSDERKNKALTIGLTPDEVSTLASIVAEETNSSDEIRTVAGLYLNRLNNGMLLQADPTVKFALQNFDLRRITNSHLSVDSPYNTYKYAGLPPGPIRFPSKTALNAVLTAEKHDYFYMCAKEDFSGRHNFARTLAEHSRNAARYHNALTERKIFK